MTPKELAFLVASGLATLASLTIVAAGIIGAAIYKRLGVPPPEHYDDGNLPGCLFGLGMIFTLITGLPTPASSPGAAFAHSSPPSGSTRSSPPSPKPERTQQ